MQNSVKEDRFKYIGGSDIPAIMGISPYKTRFQLLLEKAQLETPEDVDNIYTRYGNVMEGKIRDYINGLSREQANDPYVEGKHIIEDGDYLPFRLHTDGENEDTILEIKTTSEIHDNPDEYKIYLVQLLFYMMMTKKPKGLLAVYERPEDFSEEFDNRRLFLYPITLDNYDMLCMRISTSVSQFQKDLKRLKENPFLREEDLLQTDLVNVAEQVCRMEMQLADMKKLEADIRSMKSTLKKLMENYGVKSWTTPNGTKITLVPDSEDKEVEEEYFDMDGFKEKHPKMYKTYSKVHTILKKGKTGFVRITPPKDNE